MANSTELLDVVTVATSTSAATVATQPSDNCHTVVARNIDATDSIRVGVMANADTPGTSNSILLGPGESITWRFGWRTWRPFGPFSTSTRVLRVVAAANTPSLELQYINSTREVGP